MYETLGAALSAGQPLGVTAFPWGPHVVTSVPLDLTSGSAATISFLLSQPPHLCWPHPVSPGTFGAQARAQVTSLILSPAPLLPEPSMLGLHVSHSSCAHRLRIF